ncbi:MAG: hypothetical protein ACI8WT_002913 [Clostridium sp.]|jgi:hypothetical protein
MFGKIIDMSNTDAFINFLDGTSINVSLARLPKNSKIGDSIDLNIDAPTSMLNDSMINFL